MNYSDENIGKAFKEAFEGLEIKPSTSVWQSVNKANLQTGVAKPFAQFSNLIYSLAAAVIVFSATYFLIIHNNSPSTENKIIEKVNLIEKPIISVSKTTIDTNVTIPENIVNASIPKEDVVKEKVKEVKKTNTYVQLQNINRTKCEGINEINESEAFASIDSLENIFAKQEIKDFEEVIPEDKVEIKDKELYNNSEEINRDLITSVDTDVSTEENNDTFEVNYSDDPVICFGEDALLIAEDGYTYIWNTGDRDNQISVSPIEKSYYEVTVTNKIGQTDSHKFTVTIDKECSALLLPSAFTPNGDGKNDVFKAEGTGIIDLNIIVYNAIGQRVFECKNINQSWDGRFKGEMMPAATYFYQASYIDAKGKEHIKRGQITLIR